MVGARKGEVVGNQCWFVELSVYLRVDLVPDASVKGWLRWRWKNSFSMLDSLGLLVTSTSKGGKWLEFKSDTVWKAKIPQGSCPSCKYKTTTNKPLQSLKPALYRIKDICLYSLSVWQKKSNPLFRKKIHFLEPFQYFIYNVWHPIKNYETWLKREREYDWTETNEATEKYKRPTDIEILDLADKFFSKYWVFNKP